MNSNDIFKLLDCVIFQCKPGCTLTDARQGMLTDVLEGEAEEEKISSAALFQGIRATILGAAVKPKRQSRWEN